MYLKLVSIIFIVEIRQHHNAPLCEQKQELINQKFWTTMLSLDVHSDLTVYYVTPYPKRIVGYHLVSICAARMLMGHVLL